MHLPIINAPFRLYWAYNFNRLEQQIVAPPASFQSSSLETSGYRLATASIIRRLCRS